MFFILLVSYCRDTSITERDNYVICRLVVSRYFQYVFIAITSGTTKLYHLYGVPFLIWLSKVHTSSATLTHLVVWTWLTRPFYMLEVYDMYNLRKSFISIHRIPSTHIKLWLQLFMIFLNLGCEGPIAVTLC